MSDKMKALNDTIKELEDLKKKWSEKYQELGKYVDECNSHINTDTPNEIKDKLAGYGRDLRSIGQEYRKRIKETVDDITKDHLDNPFIKELADGILSDFDNSGGANGSREDRLWYLAGLIDMVDKLPK